jgi:hypothetical protein
MSCGRRDCSGWRCILDDDDFTKSAIAIKLLDLAVLYGISGGTLPLACAHRWCWLYAWARWVGIDGTIDGLAGVRGHNLGGKQVHRRRHGLCGSERRGGRGQGEKPGCLQSQMYPEQCRWPLLPLVCKRATHSGLVRPVTCLAEPVCAQTRTSSLSTPSATTSTRPVSLCIPQQPPESLRTVLRCPALLFLPTATSPRTFLTQPSLPLHPSTIFQSTPHSVKLPLNLCCRRIHDRRFLLM